MAPLASPAEAAFLGRNGRIALILAGDIYTVQSSGVGLKRLTSTADNRGGAQYSPNGKLIAFSSSRSGNFDIYIMTAAGTNLRRVTTAASNEISPAWSPDGLQLAFTSDRGGNTNLYRIKSTAPYGKPTQLTFSVRPTDGGSDFFSGAAWSPDGASILTSHITAFPNQHPDQLLERRSALGGALLSNFLLFGTDPDWAPRGAKIAYTDTSQSDAGVPPWITKANPDGTGKVNLTPVQMLPDGTTFEYRSPKWSPDGHQIAYTGDAPEGSGLFVMKADGTGKRLVVPFGEVLSWQPLVP